jgi:hypothetical protein
MRNFSVAQIFSVAGNRESRLQTEWMDAYPKPCAKLLFAVDATLNGDFQNSQHATIAAERNGSLAADVDDARVGVAKPLWGHE